MADLKQKKAVESLVTYVEKLQSLNEKVEPKFPKITAKKLIKDPEQYGYDVAEAAFIKYIPSFIKAYKAGKEFSKNLLENVNQD